MIDPFTWEHEASTGTPGVFEISKQMVEKGHVFCTDINKKNADKIFGVVIQASVPVIPPRNQCIYCSTSTQNLVQLWAYSYAKVIGTPAFRRKNPATGYIEWAMDYVRPAANNQQLAAMQVCTPCAKGIDFIQKGWIIFNNGDKKLIPL